MVRSNVYFGGGGGVDNCRQGEGGWGGRRQEGNNNSSQVWVSVLAFSSWSCSSRGPTTHLLSSHSFYPCGLDRKLPWDKGDRDTFNGIALAGWFLVRRRRCCRVHCTQGRDYDERRTIAMQPAQLYVMRGGGMRGEEREKRKELERNIDWFPEPSDLWMTELRAAFTAGWSSCDTRRYVTLIPTTDCASLLSLHWLGLLNSLDVGMVNDKCQWHWNGLHAQLSAGQSFIHPVVGFFWPNY